MPYSEEAMDVASQIPHIALNPRWFDARSRNAVVFKAVICVFIPFYMHLYMWHLCDPLRLWFFLLKGCFSSNVSHQPVFSLHGLFNTNCFCMLVYETVQNTTCISVIFSPCVNSFSPFPSLKSQPIF